MDQVFISHTHADERRVGAVAAALRAAGLEPWISTEQIGSAEVFSAAISRALARSRALVLVHTRRAATRPWVLSELRYALLNKVPVIVAAFDAIDPRGELAFLTTQASATVERGTRSERQFTNALVAAIATSKRKRAPVIAVLNAKGGVGKTALSANVFLAMAAHHQLRAQVLLMDIDPQHNLSQIILPESDLDEIQAAERTITSAFEPGKFTNHPSPTTDYTVLSADENYRPPSIAELRWYVQHERLLGSFDVVCGDVAMGKYTLPLPRERLQICKNRFMSFVAEAREQYDLVVLDCNPSFSFLTMCALEACSHTLSPVTPDVFAMRGLMAFRNITDALYPNLAPERLIIMNRVRRGSTPSSVEEQIRRSAVYGSGLLKARIAESAFMKASETAPVNPLDSLARFRTGNFAPEIHEELDAAAEELADRVNLH